MCGTRMSMVATCRWHNTVALSFRVSAGIIFFSLSASLKHGLTVGHTLYRPVWLELGLNCSKTSDKIYWKIPNLSTCYPASSVAYKKCWQKHIHIAMGYDYNNDTEGTDMNVKTGKFKGAVGVWSGVCWSVCCKQGGKTRFSVHW